MQVKGVLLGLEHKLNNKLRTTINIDLVVIIEKNTSLIITPNIHKSQELSLFFCLVVVLKTVPWYN